jgi:hypothetical protein
MDLTNKAIWQQAAGDTDRDYSELCIKWDAILNGPGHAGRWPDCAKPLLAAGWLPKKIADLKCFAEDMTDGDLVVLRIGTATVLAVGQIVGPYEWHAAETRLPGLRVQRGRRCSIGNGSGMEADLKSNIPLQRRAARCPPLNSHVNRRN